MTRSVMVPLIVVSLSALCASVALLAAVAAADRLLNLAVRLLPKRKPKFKVKL